MNIAGRGMAVKLVPIFKKKQLITNDAMCRITVDDIQLLWSHCMMLVHSWLVRRAHSVMCCQPGQTLMTRMYNFKCKTNLKYIGE